MSACKVDEDDSYASDCVALTRTDPIIVEMVFEVDELSEGKEGLTMRGQAYPGVSSGRMFGYAAPRKGALKEQIGKVVEQEANWLRNYYPLRPLKLQITRPDVRQLTLSEALLQ